MKEGDLAHWLGSLAEAAQADLEARNDARDDLLRRSRALIRLCARAISAAHRDAWDVSRRLLDEADTVVAAMRSYAEPFPDLFYAGYTQDAFKEWVEAHLTVAFLTDAPLPDPRRSGVPLATYLNGLAEAASEMRRRILDRLRRGGREATAEAERLLTLMDTVYEMLLTFSYPDAISGGLRRRVDQLRGVLERTRGDLTHTLQIQRLLEALETAEEAAG